MRSLWILSAPNVEVILRLTEGALRISELVDEQSWQIELIAIQALGSTPCSAELEACGDSLPVNALAPATILSVYTNQTIK